MTETEKAYIAGLLDGEGMITFGGPNIYKDGKKYRYTILVTISNTKKSLLNRVKCITGVGSVRPSNTHGASPNGKPGFVWVITGKNAQAFLRTVKKYVWLKAAQLKLALRVKLDYQFSSLPESEIQKRLTLLPRMRELNRRGLDRTGVCVE